MRNSKLTLHIFSDMIFCQQSIESFPLKFLKRIFFNLPILILATFLLLSRTSWANKRKENPKKLQKSKNRCSFHLTVSVRFFFFPANLWMKIFLTTVLFRFFMLCYTKRILFIVLYHVTKLLNNILFLTLRFLLFFDNNAWFDMKLKSNWTTDIRN